MKSEVSSTKVPSTQVKVFDWLNSIFTKTSGTTRDQLKQEVLHYLNDMVSIDSDRTARIVRDYYENEHRSIVNKLSNSPSLQLKYLGEIMKSQGDEDELEDHLVQLYVELLCKLEPKEVLPFLMKNERYSLDACLRLCMTHNVIEASAYLHERLGDTKAALELYLSVIVPQIVEQKESELEEKMRTKTHPGLLEDGLSAMKADIFNAVELCSRNAAKLDEKDNEENWFRLLDRVLVGYTQFEPFFGAPYQSVENVLSGSISSILEHMIQSVDFNKIVMRIAMNFGKIPFKHFKTDFVNVLSQYSYKKNILRKANNLLNKDIKNMTQELFGLRMRGVSSQALQCAECKEPISSEEMLKGNEPKLLLFTCGHVYHSHCLKRPICEVCKREETRKGAFISASK